MKHQKVKIVEGCFKNCIGFINKVINIVDKNYEIIVDIEGMPCPLMYNQKEFEIIE